MNGPTLDFAVGAEGTFSSPTANATLFWFRDRALLCRHTKEGLGCPARNTL